MSGDDLGDARRIRSDIPFIKLKTAAQDNAVRSGEHVAGFPREGVLNLRLRFENRELSSNRP